MDAEQKKIKTKTFFRHICLKEGFCHFYVELDDWFRFSEKV